MSGYRPVSTMAAFARHAKVKDATEGFVGDVKAVYASILGDFKHLLESVKAIKADADASNNYLVSAKMDDYIESYSKAIFLGNMVPYLLIHIPDNRPLTSKRYSYARCRRTFWLRYRDSILYEEIGRAHV